MKANDLPLQDVDQLGMLLAQIADLQARADVIKNSIKESASLVGGTQHFDGTLFRATFSESNRKTVNWTALAKECGIPQDVVLKHTKVTATFRVEVVSRV